VAFEAVMDFTHGREKRVLIDMTIDDDDWSESDMVITSGVKKTLNLHNVPYKVALEPAAVPKDSPVKRQWSRMDIVTDGQEPKDVRVGAEFQIKVEGWGGSGAHADRHTCPALPPCDVKAVKAAAAEAVWSSSKCKSQVAVDRFMEEVLVRLRARSDPYRPGSLVMTLLPAVFSSGDAPAPPNNYRHSVVCREHVAGDDDPASASAAAGEEGGKMYTVYDGFDKYRVRCDDIRVPYLVGACWSESSVRERVLQYLNTLKPSAKLPTVTERLLANLEKSTKLKDLPVARAVAPYEWTLIEVTALINATRRLGENLRKVWLTMSQTARRDAERALAAGGMSLAEAEAAADALPQKRLDDVVDFYQRFLPEGIARGGARRVLNMFRKRDRLGQGENSDEDSSQSGDSDDDESGTESLDSGGRGRGRACVPGWAATMTES